MNDIQQFKREGLTINQISALTGRDRKTIRKYLRQPRTPRYGPRQPRTTLLDPFVPYIKERLAAGVWNAVVLLVELKERGYTGGYTILKDYLRPLREEAEAVAVRRFETPPGHQAQMDWGELGDITLPDATKLPLCGFVMTLGCSRAMFADVATDEKLPTLLRMHEAAFVALGGVPKEILYDNMKTVALGTNARGEVVWHPVFEDFFRYWGFTPRLCRPYRAQTKGKVESGVGYVKKNFLCGRDATDLADLRHQLQTWLASVANVRVHGTTYHIVQEAWEAERPHLQSCQGHPPFTLPPQDVRRVARDAFVDFLTNRYSVPWKSAGKEVCIVAVCGQVQILCHNKLLATHALCLGRHQVILDPAHHEGMPFGPCGKRGKNRLSLTVSAPEVEVRSLAVYAQLEEADTPALAPTWGGEVAA